MSSGTSCVALKGDAPIATRSVWSSSTNGSTQQPTGAEKPATHTPFKVSNGSYVFNRRCSSLRLTCKAPALGVPGRPLLLAHSTPFSLSRMNNVALVADRKAAASSTTASISPTTYYARSEQAARWLLRMGNARLERRNPQRRRRHFSSVPTPR